MRTVRAAAAVALALVPIAFLPAQAAGPRPVTLTEHVTLDTSRSGTVEVLLPDDASIATGPGSLGVRFEGAGRLVGVWIDRADGTGDFLSSYRLPAFAGGMQHTYGSTPYDCKGVPNDTLPVTQDCSSASPAKALLHEGRYRLTVLADGAPLRVTLHLDGLGGDDSSLTVQRPLASVQHPLPVREGAGEHLVTFGRAVSLGVPVQTFVVATARGGGVDAALDMSSVCFRPDDGSRPFAYGPHCPGGTAGSMRYAGAGGTRGGSVFVTVAPEDMTGPVGVGGSFGNSDGVTLGQTLGVWLARR